MKFLLIFLFLSTPIFAQGSWSRTCFTSTGDCFGILQSTAGSTSSVTIYAPANLLINEESAEIRNDFIGVGFKLAVLSPEVEQKMMTANTQTLVVENDNESHILADIPDEVWNLGVNSAFCAGSSTTCVAGIWSTVTTGGLNLWVARIGCATAVVTCAMAWRDYEKWKIWTNEQKRKKAKQAATSATGESGTMPTDRPSKSDPDRIVFKNCRRLPEVTISSSEGDSWSGERLELCER